jgi:hypothetical protein
MAPKTSKGKGVAEDAGKKEVTESEMATLQTQVTLFPPTIDAVQLRDYFRPLWGVKTGGGGYDGASGHAHHPRRFC